MLCCTCVVYEFGCIWQCLFRVVHECVVCEFECILLNLFCARLSYLHVYYNGAEIAEAVFDLITYNHRSLSEPIMEYVGGDAKIAGVGLDAELMYLCF